jgi:hypothetical protein
MPTAAALVTLETPDGELRFAEGDLDRWAEHLAWCYSLIGIAEGSTIAVQDFGTSPIAYLGSKLLMPTLEAGIAERLDARVICLDASPERIVLTPEVVRQVQPDALIIRGDVFRLVLDGSSRAGVDLARIPGLTIVAALSPDDPPPPAGDFRRLLHDESSLLLAPLCTLCGSYHLRDGVYELRDGTVFNLLHEHAEACGLSRLVATGESCAAGPADTLIATPGAVGGPR